MGFCPWRRPFCFCAKGDLMFHLFAAIFWVAVAASQAPSEPAQWEKYLDQADQLRDQGRYDEAAAAYRAATKEAEKLGPGNVEMGTILMRLGRLRHLQHDYSGERSALEQALSILENRFGRDYFGMGLLLTNIAMIHHLEGHYGTAEPLYRRAIVILENAVGPEDPRTATAQEGLAKLLLVQGRNTEGEALFEKLIPALEKAHKPGDPKLATALINLAGAYRADGRYSRAEPLYRRTMALVQESPEGITNEITDGLNHFPPMLRKLKRKAEAQDLDIQIKSLLPK